MPLKIIDSSTLPLNLTNYKWAKFRKTKAGVKLHLRLVFMDKDTVYPEKAIITVAKEHDRNQLEVLVDDKEAMYVFDRGYVDYERFDRMTDDGYFFVSRLKKNAVIREVESFSLPEGLYSFIGQNGLHRNNTKSGREPFSPPRSGGYQREYSSLNHEPI